MDMNIQKYMAFVRTVEYGSFTRAAEVLNYSQSGVSRMVGDLERDWEMVLLERGKSGVRLTSDGMKLLPHAKSVCEEYAKLQMELDELHGLQSGLIRIGTFSSVATHWLPNIIRAFQKTYPNIEYELLLGDYGQIEAWIAEGRVDCGFLRLPTASEFETIFLERDRLLAILPEGHPLARLERVPVAALCEEPFMLLEKGAKAEVSEVFERCGLTPNVRFTTWDDYAIMSMVESGLGVSIMPQLLLRGRTENVCVLPLLPEASRRIALAIPKNETASPAARSFCRHTMAWIGERYQKQTDLP